MPALTREDAVFVLDLGSGENRFTLDWLTEVEAALDEVTAAEGPRALVTTASGRFFSNGLDLDWLLANPDVGPGYTARIEELFARVLAAPLYTVAALPGHAFGGGAMLALAHDGRVMRADRGYWSLPEAALGLPFMPGMAALIQARLLRPTAHEAMVTSRRYGGTEAQAAGIVDAAVEADAVRAAAMARAAEQVALAGPNLAGIKTTMYAPVLAALRSARS